MAYIGEMEGQKYIEKTRQYLDYLEEHIENVRQAFILVSDACVGMSWVGLDDAWYVMREQVIYHDISKFSAEEFTQYRDYFFPIEESVKCVSAFEDAWEHHKKVNTHHHETAKDSLDIVHMVIDWTAMSFKFGDTPWEYYEKNKNRIKLSKEFEEYMFEILDRLKKVWPYDEK